MKKFFLFACVAAALVSCSSDEFLGENQEMTQKVENDGSIQFKAFTGKASRATQTGAAAAALLGNNFVVEGVKGNGDYTGTLNQSVVFDHYNVNYAASTANTTESNTNDWEYVGIGKHGLSAAAAQTIKYWDYSAKQYDFVAFSYGKSDYEKAVLTEIDYTKLGAAVTSGTPVYTVTGNAAELAKTYIADLVTMYNRDGVSEFGKTAVITPKFRSLGTKVRMAFYETVPGYSVKNLKFYNAAWDGSTATTEEGSTTPTLFAANAIFPNATSKGTMSVYYPTVGWANSANGTLSPDYNQAHVTFAAGSESGDALVTTKTFGNITYTTYTENTLSITDALGITSAKASYAGNGTDNNYQTVLPLGTKDNLQLRVEYDLVSTDGSGETIHVRDARAVVPAEYADWKPNYAYTYIFKISENTNGWTGVDGSGNVVEGLTPITFNAQVIETEDGIQETITTVAAPSITTYQEGVSVSSYSEYSAGDIYASVMNGTTAVDLSSLTAPAGLAVYVATATDPKIITEALVQDQLNGTKHDTGITLASCGYTVVSEVPAVDGNTLSVSAVKFTVAANKTYVFQYTDGSRNYVKVIRVKA